MHDTDFKVVNALKIVRLNDDWKRRKCQMLLSQKNTCVYVEILSFWQLLFAMKKKSEKIL